MLTRENNIAPERHYFAAPNFDLQLHNLSILLNGMQMYFNTNVKQFHILIRKK